MGRRSRKSSVSVDPGAELESTATEAEGATAKSGASAQSTWPPEPPGPSALPESPLSPATVYDPPKKVSKRPNSEQVNEPPPPTVGVWPHKKTAGTWVDGVKQPDAPKARSKPRGRTLDCRPKGAPVDPEASTSGENLVVTMPVVAVPGDTSLESDNAEVAAVPEPPKVITVRVGLPEEREERMRRRRVHLHRRRRQAKGDGAKTPRGVPTEFGNAMVAELKDTGLIVEMHRVGPGAGVPSVDQAKLQQLLESVVKVSERHHMTLLDLAAIGQVIVDLTRESAPAFDNLSGSADGRSTDTLE